MTKAADVKAFLVPINTGPRNGSTSINHRGCLVGLLALSVFMTGCSDPKAATEKNFIVAIQSFLDTTYPKCYFNEKFPATIPDFNLRGEKAIFEAMVKVGLLAKKDEEHVEKRIFGKDVTVVKPTFYLTDEGKKFYKPDAVKNLRGETVGGFCMGQAKVKQIPQFSEPSDMFGQKISRVNYTYEVSNLPSWTKDPAILLAMPKLKIDVESGQTPIKALDAVVLTNNGWIHERLFQK
jgi:hypothetical protein